MLFQMAITSLSQHNAFEGKHSSVGERSMLGVFQEVAKNVGRSAGWWARDLRSDVRGHPDRAQIRSSAVDPDRRKELQDIDPFAVRVLKALFLVKYVKEFKPTVRNISVLLLSEFDTDQVKTAAQDRRGSVASGAQHATSSAMARSMNS